jgi:hypothetical protein
VKSNILFQLICKYKKPIILLMYSTFIASCIAAIAMAVTDNVDGTSGAAPCIDPYLAVCGECNAEIGVDPPHRSWFRS